VIKLNGLYKLRNGQHADVKPAEDFAETGRHVGSSRETGLLIEWDLNGLATRPTRNVDLDVMQMVRPGEGQ
jgi:hypothetical protein